METEITIPEWVKNSHLYKEGKFKEEEKLPIWELKKIESFEEFKDVLYVIHFWQVQKPFPEEIWEFIITKDKEKIQKIFEKRKYWPYFRSFLVKRDSENDLCKKAVFEGEIFLLKYLHKNNYSFNNLKIAVTAIIRDHFDCFKYVIAPDGNLENGCKITENLIKEVLMNKNLFYLQFLHDNNLLSKKDSFGYASAAGNLSHLIFLNDNGYKFNSCTILGAVGNIECLKYLHKLDNIKHSSNYYRNILCSTAAKQGNLECLIYLHEHGYIWDRKVLVNACYRDSVECLEYAHTSGLPLDEKLFSIAVEKGSYECLKYLSNNNCPIPEKIPLYRGVKKANEICDFLVATYK